MYMIVLYLTRVEKLRAGSSIVELQIDWCASVQKLDGYLLSYTVTKSLAWMCTCNSEPPVLQIIKTAQCQMLLINHQICNKPRIDLEARGAQTWKSKTFRPSELCKKIFCTVAMIFPFHSEPFSRRAPGVSALQLMDLFLAVPPLAAEWNPASADVSVAPSLDIYICLADKSWQTRGHFWGRIELLVMQ